MKYYLIKDSSGNVTGAFLTNDGAPRPDATEVDEATYSAEVAKLQAAQKA